MTTTLSPSDQLRAGRLTRRLLQLLAGLALYGVSMALVVRAGLGQIPWDVLHVGLARQLPFTLGQVVIGVSLLVLLLWIPLRQKPGLGTILNAILIGFALDATLPRLPAPGSLPAQVAMAVTGVLLNAVATASYIGSHLGPGPRDGLMTGLSRHTGASIRLVRTAIEIVVVLAGWALGGAIGFGTILYAVAIGPLTQLLLPWFAVGLHSEPPAEDAS